MIAELNEGTNVISGMKIAAEQQPMQQVTIPMHAAQTKERLAVILVAFSELAAQVKIPSVNPERD